jgi:uncharacterized protein YjlB
LTTPQPETLRLQPDGGIPNSGLPVLQRGDVLVLPAGAGHCNEGDTGDLVVVGAYPNGMGWDLRRGEADEYDEVIANIAAVPLPDTDPVGGPLTELWSG